jgi:GAF domain-containing protein
MSLPDKSLDQGARLEHYRLMTAIAVDGKAAKIEQPIIRARHKRINLFSVATIMNVPVVLATYRDQNGMETFATHGLDLNNNLARFGVACNELCKGGVIVVPDTHAHPALGTIARHWPTSEIRFLVAIPLRNSAGRIVGSLAVMNSQKAVASRGISFKMLNEFGKAFADEGMLHAGTLAA